MMLLLSHYRRLTVITGRQPAFAEVGHPLSLEPIDRRSNKMRIATLVATTVLLATQPVWADIVRHSAIPSAFWGTWAAGSDTCQKKGPDVIVLSAKRFVQPESKCRVDWVDETAAAQGPIYSAHLRCTSVAKPARKTISNVVLARKDAKNISMGSDLYDLKIYEPCSEHKRATQ